MPVWKPEDWSIIWLAALRVILFSGEEAWTQMLFDD